MTSRRTRSPTAPLAAILLLLAPLPLVGGDSGLEKYKTWSKSPEFVYLATEAEIKEWKKVTTDADAEKFIALFWARRDPDPKTAPNQFKARLDALVALADTHFVLPTVRGALTERGKLFILVGPPWTMSHRQGTKPHAPGLKLGEIATGENDPGTTLGESITTFIYESKQLPDWAGIKSLVATFAVERTRDSLLGPGDVRRLQVLAARVALKNPDLKEVPAAVAGGTITVSTAIRKPGELPPWPLSPEANEALEAAISKEPFGSVTALPLAYRDGGARLMLQIYLEGAGPSEPARLAWLVRGKDGKESVSSEEAAGLRRVLQGVVTDRAFPLPPGDYDVAVVLLDASGAAAHTAKRSVGIASTPAEFTASSLFLAIADLPTQGATADAPFLFAGRKFVARGESRLKSTDGISFLVRLYNPGVDPSTKKAFVKRTIRIQPKAGASIEVPSSPDEPVAVKDPEAGGAVVLDVAGTVAENNIGDYFRPGDYTLKLTVEDVVKKSKIEVSHPFTLLPKEK
ncbi:MAG: GWxTD domain-containing protein [Thermoanaerobaculia bacterium]